MMKNIYILLVVALGCLLATSCDYEEITYDGPAFVSWYPTSGSQFRVTEAGDGQTLDLRIGVSNLLSENLTLNLAVVDSLSEAIEGYDFELVNSSVTIPAGEYYGIVKIKGIYENLTPEALSIVLQITNIPSHLYNSNQGDLIEILISQHYDLTVEELTGTYIQSDYASDGTVNSYQVEISGVEGEDNMIQIKNFWNKENLTVYATIDAINFQLIFDNQVIGKTTLDEDIMLHPLEIQGGSIYVGNGTEVRADCKKGSFTLQPWGALVFRENGVAQAGLYVGSVFEKQD